MKIKRLYNNIFNIVTMLMVTMFFSCNDSFKEVQKMNVSENEPIGIAEDINLKHTDSGRVTANLLSPKMLDFTNREFPYSEFPDGIILNLYDEQDRKSIVVADYAIIYDKTNLLDLQGNVVITSENGVLKTEQLYYDQSKEWLFTNKPVEYETETDIINGNGFDSNSKFTNAEVLEVTGIIAVED